MPRQKTILQQAPSTSQRVPTPEEATTYLRTIFKCVGLSEAVVEYDPTPVEGEAWAEFYLDDSVGVKVRFNPALFGKPAEFQRLACAHEAGHFITKPLDMVRDALAGPENKGLRRMVKRAEEYIVDRYAYAVAKLCPLPPWC